MNGEVRHVALRGADERRASEKSKHPFWGPRTGGDNGNKTALELISPRSLYPSSEAGSIATELTVRASESPHSSTHSKNNSSP